MRKLLTFIAALNAAFLCILLAASPAGSGGFLLLAAPKTFSLTFQSSVSSAATTLTVDYSTMTYGSGNTRIIVAIAYRSATQGVAGVTIGGVSLTQVASAASSGGNPDFTDIWISSGSLAGSSGDVQVTYSAAPASGSNAVALYNLVTTTPAVSSANNGGTAGATTASAAITVPSGGGGIVVGEYEGSHFSTAGNFTVDSNIGTGRFIFGHTTATGAVTPTLNASASDNIGISAAAWGP